MNDIVAINKLGVEDLTDFKRLVEIFKDVFENTDPIVNDEQLQKLLSNPNFWVFVITVGNKVVGGLTIHVLNSYYHTKPVAYIYDVGISPPFQRQGLGKALIAHVCQFCELNGFEEAYVEAESIDTDAVQFYRQTDSSHEMNAVHFTYTFNKKSQTNEQ